MARLISWLVAFALLLVVGAVSTPSKHHRDVAVRLTRRQSTKRCSNRNRHGSPAIAALNTTSISSSSSTSSHAQLTSSSRLVTSTRRAAAATTASSRPVIHPAQPSYISGAHSGDGTYYDAGLGACGITNNNTDFIVAVSTTLYDTYRGATANPNLNPICNKGIKAWRAGYPDRAVNVIVTDRCGGCAPDDLDFTYSAFLRLGELGEGRIKIQWAWAEAE